MNVTIRFNLDISLDIRNHWNEEDIMLRCM